MDVLSQFVWRDGGMARFCLNGMGLGGMEFLGVDFGQFGPKSLGAPRLVSKNLPEVPQTEGGFVAKIWKAGLIDTFLGVLFDTQFGFNTFSLYLLIGNQWVVFYSKWWNSFSKLRTLIDLG